MRVDQMRAIVSQRYPNHRWGNRVKKMPDRQVIAIYHSIMERRKKEEEQKCQEKENRQMRFW